MGEANGRNQWLVWSAGTILGIILFGMGILVNGVIANDRERVAADTIASERSSSNKERIAKLEECVLSVKSDISAMKTDVRLIMRAVVK